MRLGGGGGGGEGERGEMGFDTTTAYMRKGGGGGLRKICARILRMAPRVRLLCM